MERSQSRQGFLVSAIVHLLILMALSSRVSPPAPEAAPSTAPPDVRQRVFLPAARDLRRMAEAARPTPPPPPRPQPTPPPTGKDRISIGAPSPLRQKEPLILRPDEDITKVRKGTAQGDPAPQPSPSAGAPAAVAQARAGEPQPAPSAAAPGLRLPPGLGALPRGAEDPQRGVRSPSLSSALRDLDERLRRSEALGAPTGTGQQMGPLFFDPEGADFTKWIDHFRQEVYRNWIMPQPALMGFKGRVAIEFTVERDGSISSLRITGASGTGAFDRAAQHALQASRFLPLPADFRPARVTMQVIFFYNEAPQGA